MPLLEAHRIGNYLVDRLVAERAGETLYLVTDEAAREQRAMLLSTAPDAAARFAHQALLAGLVDHPDIVKVFEVAALPDGTPYLISEAIAGETLAARLGQRPRLPQNEALRLCQRLAAALAVLHEHGVIHCDVRPEHVLLLPAPGAPGGERVKITDLSCAQRYPAVSEATPAAYPEPPPDAATYLAPEQCQGAGAVSDRADVYALGVMLYQMLSGQPPFTGRSPTDIRALHVVALPPPLGRHGVVAPDELLKLLVSMLVKDASSRPPMREVAERLERLRMQNQMAATLHQLPAALATAPAADTVPPASATTTPLAASAPGLRVPLPLLGGMGVVVVALLLAWLLLR